MTQNLSDNTIVSMNEILNESNEKSILEQCYHHIRLGKDEMNSIKERILQINEDINISPKIIYDTITEENQHLDAMHKKFNESCDSIRKLNENVIGDQKECEEKLKEIQAEQNALELRLKRSEERLLQKISKLQMAEKEFEDSCKKLKNQKKVVKLQIFLIILLILLSPLFFYLTHVYAELTSSKEDYVGTLFVSVIICCLCLSVGLVRSFEFLFKERKNVKKARKEKELSLKKVDEEKYERDILSNDFDKVTQKVDDVQKMLKDQQSKQKEFETAIKILCRFQLTLEKWQEPLNEVINVYQTHYPVPSNLAKLKERDQRNFTNIMLDILIKAKDIYSNNNILFNAEDDHQDDPNNLSFECFIASRI